MSDEMVVYDNENNVTDLVASPDVMAGLSYIDPANMPDLDAAEVGMDISPRYMEFKDVGEHVRGFYVGMSSITSKKNNETKIVPAAIFQNKDGFYLNSGDSLVDKLRKVPVGTAVQITYKGTEKTSKGNDVKTYDIRMLNVKPGQRPALQSVQQQPAQAHVQDNPISAPMFNTPDALFTQVEADFGYSINDAKMMLKSAGFTGFTPSNSAKMYRVFLELKGDEIPF